MVSRSAKGIKAMGGWLYRLSGSSDFAILNFVEVFFSSLSKFSIPDFIPEPSVEHPSAISRAASANRFIDQVKIFFSRNFYFLFIIIDFLLR